MRLLAINFGGLGDEILFLPTLSSLKKAHPQWQITLLTEPRSRSIAELTDLIDEIICFDIKKEPLQLGDYIDLIKLLRSGGYDLVLSSGGSARVAQLLFLSGIKKRIGYDSGPLSQLLLSKAVKLNKEQYAAYMYHDLVRGLDIDFEPDLPRLEANADNITHMQTVLSPLSSSRKTVLIHPGTSRLAVKKGIIKHWAPTNWAQLIDHLLSAQLNVVLAGGPDDDETIVQIEHALSGDSHKDRSAFINCFGQTKGIKDLAALLSLADLVVCVDSAPMHMAFALNKDLIALFGPTDPAKLIVENPRTKIICQDPELRNQPSPGVRIHLDTVIRAVEDQLKRIASREN